MNTYLSLDIGGTQIKYAVISAQGQMQTHGTMATETRSLRDFMETLQQLVDRYRHEVSGIAICVPGQVLPHQTRVAHGGALPFLDGVDFAQALKTDLPIAVINDGKAATLAELWRGQLSDLENGVVLVLGTAVGGGIVLQRHLLAGEHAQAGEVSFMSTSDLDPTHMVGGVGSAVGMIQRINQATGYQPLEDGYHALAQVQEKNPQAQAIFSEFCGCIALLIHNIQAVLDVGTFVIAGGIAANPQVAAGIRNAFAHLRSSSEFVDATLARPTIVGSTMKNTANLYGAIYHLMEETK